MVAEVQGLDGAFTFSEKLLQKLWLRGDFERAVAATMEGRRVQIVHPGKWNLLGGPDFRAARLRFDDGRETVGDIEVHLRAGDWAAHRHAEDAAYDDVILHVVLFPPEGATATRGAGGREIPVLALLPPANRKARFYVGEAELASLAPGQRVAITCDGCGATIGARISRIAAQPEYTPPVIYSNAQRAKLVFMVEARPEPADAPRLHPGQPLEVRRDGAN